MDNYSANYTSLVIPSRKEWLINIISPTLIIIDSIIIIVAPIVDIQSVNISIVFRVTSVLIKNMQFKMFLKSDNGTYTLNILRDPVPYQWSRNLNHFSAIFICGTFSM